MPFITKTVVFLLLTIFIACNQNNDTGYDLKRKYSLKDINPNSLILVGKWTICSGGCEDGSMILYNVCPEFVFNSNGFADLSVGEFYKWRVIKDTLFLSPLSPDNNDTSFWFTDYKYLIIKNEDSTSIRIQLKQLEKRCFSNLSREKEDLFFRPRDFLVKSKK